MIIRVHLRKSASNKINMKELSIKIISMTRRHIPACATSCGVRALEDPA